MKDAVIEYVALMRSNESSEEMLGTDCGNLELPPADLIDPVIEAYKADVDRTLLRENLRLTPQERSEKFLRSMEMIYELKRAGRSHRGEAGVQEA